MCGIGLYQIIIFYRSNFNKNIKYCDPKKSKGSPTITIVLGIWKGTSKKKYYLTYNENMTYFF